MRIKYPINNSTQKHLSQEEVASCWTLFEKDKIENQIFNVGYQNMSINEIAILVKKVVQREYPNKKEINKAFQKLKKNLCMMDLKKIKQLMKF